ncbi:MAG: hypothetical protein IPG64_13715 [Haliea sp.]|nr:hypothetical protein [Haliea sp.]
MSANNASISAESRSPYCGLRAISSNVQAVVLELVWCPANINQITMPVISWSVSLRPSL